MILSAGILKAILVPRGRVSFVENQESRTSAGSDFLNMRRVCPILSQSDLPGLVGSPWIVDFRCLCKPTKLVRPNDVTLKERGLWGRECFKGTSNRHKQHKFVSLSCNIFSLLLGKIQKPIPVIKVARAYLSACTQIHTSLRWGSCSSFLHSHCTQMEDILLSYF